MLEIVRDVFKVWKMLEFWEWCLNLGYSAWNCKCFTSLFRLKENKEVWARLIASLLHNTAPLRPSRAMRVTGKCFCYVCDLGILMRVIDDSMPGGCRFNERWLAEGKYKPWLRRWSSPRVASCKVCNNNDARVCADEPHTTRKVRHRRAF